MRRRAEARRGLKSGVRPGRCSSFLQLNGFVLVHFADHSETMNRCAGRLHDAFGSNMWSWRT